ncbi:MAG TPA: chorismate mutase, partial [Ilumatobacteraceae bacterium]
MGELDDLRSRIDQLDSALIAIVAERLAVCRQVAAVKEGSDTPVIQPARVRDVVVTRRQQAIEAGIDPDFAEQLFRVLLTETHRIEVAGHRPDAAPEKP